MFGIITLVVLAIPVLVLVGFLLILTMRGRLQRLEAKVLGLEGRLAGTSGSPVIEAAAAAPPTPEAEDDETPEPEEAEPDPSPQPASEPSPARAHVSLEERLARSGSCGRAVSRWRSAASS